MSITNPVNWFTSKASRLLRVVGYNKWCMLLLRGDLVYFRDFIDRNNSEGYNRKFWTVKSLTTTIQAGVCYWNTKRSNERTKKTLLVCTCPVNGQHFSEVANTGCEGPPSNRLSISGYSLKIWRNSISFQYRLLKKSSYIKKLFTREREMLDD